MSLMECAACHRHMRRSETSCPFCGSAVSSAAPERRLPTVRLSRTALLAFAATALGAGCGGKETGLGSGTETMTGGAGGTGAMGAGGRAGTGGRIGSGGVLGTGGFNPPPPYGTPPPPPGYGGSVALPYGIPPGGFGNFGGAFPIGGTTGTATGGKTMGGSGGTLADSGAPDATPDAADAALPKR
jgi:hypothetical protein